MDREDPEMKKAILPETPPAHADYATAVLDTLGNLGCRLAIEPGPIRLPAPRDHLRPRPRRLVPGVVRGPGRPEPAVTSG